MSIDAYEKQVFGKNVQVGWILDHAFHYAGHNKINKSQDSGIEKPLIKDMHAFQ